MYSHRRKSEMMVGVWAKTNQKPSRHVCPSPLYFGQMTYSLYASVSSSVEMVPASSISVRIKLCLLHLDWCLVCVKCVYKVAVIALQTWVTYSCDFFGGPLHFLFLK